jgi:spore germination cell wall hydrolase CwlJ-like protein
VICRKKNLKAFRLLICLAFAIAVSSVFLNIEPMASEAPEEFLASLEQNASEEDAQRLTQGYGSSFAPLSTEKDIYKPLSAGQTSNADDQSASTMPATAPQPDATNTPSTESDTAIETPTEESSYSEESSVDFSMEPAHPEQPSYEENSAIHAAASGSGQPVEGEYSDLDLLAAICQIEAGYDYDGCLAVANVVLNRLNTGFDDCQTIYEVIYYPNQFAITRMPHYLKNGTSSIARQAAADALAGANNIGDYLYFYAEWYAKPETLTCPYLLVGGNCFLNNSL